MSNVSPKTALVEQGLRALVIREPLTITPDRPIQEAIALMNEAQQVEERVTLSCRRSSCVVVLEDQRVIGLVTASELVHLWATQTSLGAITVQKAMNPEVMTLQESTLGNSLQVLASLAFHPPLHLILIDDQERLVGLMTYEALQQLHQRLQKWQEAEASGEAKYQQIIEISHEGIWLIDADAKHQFGNPALLRMLGRTAKEMEGRSLMDFFAPELHPHIQELLQRRQSGIAETNEVPILRGDGSTLWVLASASPMFDQAGQYVGAIAMLADITDYKLVQEAIQAENHFRELILENLAEGLCVCSVCSDYPFVEFTVWNPCMELITGYTQVEINELGWYQTLYPDPKLQAQAIARMTAMQAGDHILGEEWTIRHRDGSDRVVSITTSLLQNTEGQTNVLAIMQDVTARRQAELLLKSQLAAIEAKETELRRINTELAQANRLKDEFLANMSHELRTPLNAILGMTEGMQEAIFGPVNDRQIKALRTVESSANHLLSLINDILDVAKIESGQVQLERGQVPIDYLCESSLAFVKQQALKKNIQLKTLIPRHLPDLFVDEIRMRQALLNLLTNAVKFTPADGTITLSISLFTQKQSLAPQTYLRFAVTDTGIGIVPENIAKLFQPFVQIDSALNRQHTGTGLGLALVKQIVELHGGQVGLTSKPGKGSCFTIDLPYETSVVCPAPAGDWSATQTAPLPETLRYWGFQPDPLILLAEDNQANVLTISYYLEAKGYRLVFAKNGQEAIDLALAHHPDLILMDIQMPILDGLEAIKCIRQQEKFSNTPIIALTALTMAGDQESCLAAGANRYLSKPIKLRQLDRTIQELLLTRC
jgi:PAS domain S-box-containing protein